MAAAIFGGCTGGSILTGWALYLGCSLPLAALIGASGQLGVLLQFPSAWCTSMFGVRATAIWTFAISRQTPLTLVLLPFLAMSREAKQVVLIAVTIFTALLASVGGNAVLVWHGDLVPERFRGRYFGLRDALFTISAMISSMVAGIVLDRYKASGSVGGGLAGITAVACFAGAGSTYFMTRQRDPAPSSPCALTSSAVRRIISTGALRRVLSYEFAWNGALGLTASAFTVYMLVTLHLSFTEMAVYAATVAIVRSIVVVHWGRAIDARGAGRALMFCSLGLVLVPAVWFLSRTDRLWPVWAGAVLEGALLGGHSVATNKLWLAVTSRDERPVSIAILKTAEGASYGLGAAVAALVLRRVPEFHPLFALAVAARLGAAILTRGIAPRSRSAR